MFIAVEDDVLPIFTWTPYDVTYLTQPGVYPVPVNWIEPVVNDNSGNVILESNYQPMDNFSLGITVVNYTATAPNGLTANFTFTVSVYGRLLFRTSVSNYHCHLPILNYYYLYSIFS